MKLNAVFMLMVLSFSPQTFAAEVTDACSQDRIRFCEGKSGQQCLTDRISEISAGCKQLLEKASVGKLNGMKAQAVGKATNVKTACSTEIASLCANVALVGGGLNKCLKKNYEQLSAGCQKSVDQSKGK
jgi:hypothetical protein